MTHTIVLSRELDEAVYNCRKALQKANEAIRELFKLADYPTPTTLADVTTSNLLAFIEQRINAVKSTPIYTQAQKRQVIDDWTEWRFKAMPFVVAVENFVTDWQEVSPVLDTATMTILTSDITEALTPRFTVEIPLPAHRHLQLINNVRHAYYELREWEQEQDINKVELKKLLSLTESDLFQSWASGAIKVNHDFDDDPSLRAWRQAQTNAIF